MLRSADTHRPVVPCPWVGHALKFHSHGLKISCSDVMLLFQLQRETRKLQQAFRSVFPSTSLRISRSDFVELVGCALSDEDLGGIPREAFHHAAELIFDSKLSGGGPGGGLGSGSVPAREAISFFRLGYSDAAGVPMAHTAVLPAHKNPDCDGCCPNCPQIRPRSAGSSPAGGRSCPPCQ